MSTTTKKQYMSFGSEQHPFRYNHWLNEQSNILYYFTARSSFSTSAQRYSDGSSGCEEVSKSNMEILALFTYLYWSVYETLFIPRKKKKKRGSKDDEQEEEQESQLQEEGEAARQLLDATMNRNADALFALSEVVPHYKPKSENIAGLSLRIVSNNQTITFGSKLCYLFVENEKRMTAEMKGRGPSLNMPLFKTITFERYCELVGIYSGVPVCMDDRNRENLFKAGASINPLQVFNIHRCCRLAKAAYASPLYTHVHSYIGEDGTFGFPEAESVYLLKHEYMFPNNFHSFMWPHICKPTDDGDAQKRMFIRQHVKQANDEDTDDEDADTEAARLQMEFDIGALYDQYYRIEVSKDNAMDIASLKKRQKFRMEKINHLANDFESMKVARTLVQQQGLDEFDHIFHMDGDVPNSIKAIAKWHDLHLSKFRNYCLPSPKISKNMSRFADNFCSFAVQLECVFKVAVLHVPIIKGIINNLHVYSNRPFHTHTLIVGKPRLGKTFIFQVMQLLLIAKTWQEYANVTAKADTTGSKEFNHMIEFMEEALPALLGIVHNTVARKQQATAGTDAESLFKIKTTRGKLVSKRAEHDEVTGKWATVETETDCNCVENIASNDPLAVMSEAIVNRFDAYEVPEKHRKDGGDVNSKIQYNHNRAATRMKDERVYRVQRNQALVARVFYLIDAGVLHPINMGAAHIIFLSVLRRAKQVGLTNTDDVRNLERLMFQVEVEVILDAIDTLFDSEISPLKNKKWERRDILLIEPYLRATTEHCVFALGLLHNQFESDVTKEVIRTLKRSVFGKSVAAECAGSEPYPNVGREIADEQAAFLDKYKDATQEGLAAYISERVDQIKANKEYFASFNSMYYVIDFPVQAVPSQQQQQSKSQYYRPPDRALTKDELLDKLKDIVLRKMNTKPKGDEVVRSLKTLMELTIPDENGEPSDSVFALHFTDNKAYLAKSVVKNAEKNSLKTVIVDVLSKLTRTRKQYIYGVAYEELPYIFDSIIVEPTNNEAPVTIADPNYVDEQLKIYNNASSRDMYEELIDKTEEFGYEARAEFASSVFSKTPYITLDAGIDRYVTAQHLRSIYVNATDMEGMPSAFPDIYHKQVMSAVEDEVLHNYPGCFPLTVKDVIDTRKRKTNVDETSVRAKCSKILNELGFVLPPEQDDVVCVVGEDVYRELEDEEDVMLENFVADKMNIESIENAAIERYAALYDC
jgi:hypothetical protein